MANLKEWIELNLDHDEVIESVCLGSLEEDENLKRNESVGKLIKWEVARELLDFDWDDGGCWNDCNPVVLWTNKNIIFMVEYDSYVCMKRLPRHPKEFNYQVISGSFGSQEGWG